MREDCRTLAFGLSLIDSINHFWQSEILCRRSKSDLAVFAWVSWTWRSEALVDSAKEGLGPSTSLKLHVAQLYDLLWTELLQKPHSSIVLTLCSAWSVLLCSLQTHEIFWLYIYVPKHNLWISWEESLWAANFQFFSQHVTAAVSFFQDKGCVTLCIKERKHENFTTWLTCSWHPHCNVGRYMSIFDILHQSIGCYFMWCQSIFPSLDLSLSVAPSAFVDILLSWVQLSWR